MIIEVNKCKQCGRDLNEYDPSWICAKNHKWQSNWRKDKTSEKYKQYLRKRNKSMKDAARKRLDKLNKKRPKEYEQRRKNQPLHDN